MNELWTCQTCDYLTLVLQRPAACERHAPPVERVGESRFLASRGPVAFSDQELASLKALRASVRGRLGHGGTPDDLPGAVWPSLDS